MPPGLARTFLAVTLVIFVQLGLGATMRHRHAGLAVPDFPLAQGQLWPRTDSEAIARYNQQRVEVHAARAITATDVLLHMAHRVWALAVVGGVVVAWVRTRRCLPAGHPLRRGTGVWLGLIGVQFALGAVTVWTNKAADIATAHVVVGSLGLAVGGSLWLLASRPRLGGGCATAAVPAVAGSSAPAIAPAGNLPCS
jgi:cytochrome c oxidase assembly protein subunit 15